MMMTEVKEYFQIERKSKSKHRRLNECHSLKHMVMIRHKSMKTVGNSTCQTIAIHV